MKVIVLDAICSIQQGFRMSGLASGSFSCKMSLTDWPPAVTWSRLRKPEFEFGVSSLRAFLTLPFIMRFENLCAVSLLA